MKPNKKQQYPRKNEGLYIYNIDNDLKQTELLVLSVILNTCAKNKKLKSQDNKAVCYLRNKQFADILKINDRTVTKTLQSLLKKGLIVLNKDYDDEECLYVEDECDDEDNTARSIIPSRYVRVNKEFKGFMIPKNILDTKDLSKSEKIIFGYLYSWGKNNKICKAKTDYIQKVCKIKSKGVILETIRKFKDLGLVDASYENNSRALDIRKTHAENFILNPTTYIVDKIGKINEVNKVSKVDTIENVNVVESIGRVDKVILNSFSLDSVDLSKLNKEDIGKLLTTTENLVELYRLAFNSKA